VVLDALRETAARAGSVDRPALCDGTVAAAAAAMEAVDAYTLPTPNRASWWTAEPSWDATGATLANVTTASSSRNYRGSGRSWPMSTLATREPDGGVIRGSGRAAAGVTLSTLRLWVRRCQGTAPWRLRTATPRGPPYQF
jgi:hypothetical protein